MRFVHSRTARLLALLASGLLLNGCATGAGEPEAGLATVALEQRAAFGGVAVTPLRVEEDSRCPAGVQCIQAGTVRVTVRLEGDGAPREALLTLDRPVGLADGRALSLAAVCPYRRHPGAISPASYRFTFTLGGDEAAAAAPACAP